MNGLDAFILPQPLSSLFSILLVAGLGKLGHYLLNLALPQQLPGIPVWLRSQSILIGVAAVLALAFPLALAGFFPRSLATTVGILLTIAGAYEVQGTLRGSRSHLLFVQQWAKRSPIHLALTTTLLTGYFVLSLAPATDADSLDYHLGVALEVLKQGAFPFSPEWFHSRLAGSGEVLETIGLAVGAEQFGSLLQFSAVLCLYRLLTNLRGNEGCIPWFGLLLIQSPLFLSLIPSHKPMLLPVAMITASLAVTAEFLGSRNPACRRHVDISFSLVCLLTMAAANMKLNYLLSGAVVGCLALYYTIRRGRASASLLIGLISFLCIIGPFFLWKLTQYGATSLGNLLAPFPGNWPATETFAQDLRQWRDSATPFPFSLLFPSSIGVITTTLGLGIVISLHSLYLYRKYKTPQSTTYTVAAVFFVIPALFLGQHNSRFFLEPYIWLLLAATSIYGTAHTRWGEWCKPMAILQGAIVVPLVLFGAFTLGYGSLTPQTREAVMETSALGYRESLWLGKTLPPDAIVIHTTRTVALSPRQAIANDWRSHLTENSPGAAVYYELVKKKNPGFIVATSAPGEVPAWPNCETSPYAGPFQTSVATRNPFNAGARYDVWVFRITNLESCRW